jgi:hypothetical protein
MLAGIGKFPCRLVELVVDFALGLLLFLRLRLVVGGRFGGLQVFRREAFPSVQVVVVSVATGGVVVSESAARAAESAASETAAQTESSVVWRSMVMDSLSFESPADVLERGLLAPLQGGPL